MGVGMQIALHFDDIVLITHHATNLILPGGVDITTEAGDELRFVEYELGKWRCLSASAAAGGGGGGSISDAAYGASWDGDTINGASKNALYDELESKADGSISDTAYGVGWNGDSNAASKNALYDELESKADGSISNTAFGVGWNGDSNAASKNALYDELKLKADAGANGDITSLTALSGQQAIPSIDLTSGQIEFPATMSASTNVNTLDDYEEGTFDPALTFGGGSTGLTYNLRNGSYVKIGKRVVCNGVIQVGSVGSSTGLAVVNGLPFTSSNSLDAYSVPSLGAFLITFTDYLQGMLGRNTSYFILETIANDGIKRALTNADFRTSSMMLFSLTYGT